MAQGRYDQQPQLKEAGEACGDGFPVCRNMISRNMGFQLGRDYQVRYLPKRRLQFLPRFLGPCKNLS